VHDDQRAVGSGSRIGHVGTGGVALADERREQTIARVETRTE
jgi:hypothetical protein